MISSLTFLGLKNVILEREKKKKPPLFYLASSFFLKKKKEKKRSFVIMNSSTKLDSALFQLTPTRTRFDLVVIVSGKKEKVASGLLDPFISHLKVAQDQMAKGGYSIVLVPDHGSDWFTKGTVERFVRFVSTPEILERVYTLESEILQIEEAIAIQGNTSVGISSLEENQMKLVETVEGRKSHKDINEDNAVVLYKSDAQQAEANGTTKSEINPKVQLLKVLETRKSALQKEQGMAFARAVAAGFNIDCMPSLMSFAHCFEASRLMDACRRFMALWKRKHESGQWLEIEAAEAVVNHTDFSAINASGITISNTATTFNTELESGSYRTTNSEVDQQPTAGLQDNFQGQFSHHGFSPWPLHSSPGVIPAFQQYPVHGIPYYQTYPGNNSFLPPCCPPAEDPRLNAGQNVGYRRHSMDNGLYNAESDALEMEYSKSRLQDEVDMEREGSQTGERRKKASRSGRRKSDTVVIQNINYITKTEHNSGSESYSDSASETGEDKDTQESVKTYKRKGASKKYLKKSDSSDKDGEGHWQAFQNCLLRDIDEDRHAIDQGKFGLENVDHARRKKHAAVKDPLDFSERDMHDIQGGKAMDIHNISRGRTCMPKSSNDDLSLSRNTCQSGNGRFVDNLHSQETAGRRNGYRRASNDDFVILKPGNANPSSNMEALNEQGYSNIKLERNLFNDESCVVDDRSVKVNGAGSIERNAMDMDSEFPVVLKKKEKYTYQPDELRLMPERGAEKGSVGYDPALDYEIQAQAKGADASRVKNKGSLALTKPEIKTLNKEHRSKLTPNNSDRNKTARAIRRGKTNKPSPLDEARARAERLRNYKADLQKMRKKKEEEEKKRLEALKMERQKRIAARSSAVTTKSASQVTNKQLPSKLSPFSLKGSKFSDSEPRSSSPFHRFPFRTASAGFNGSSKTSKTSRSNIGSHSAPYRLSRSVPSPPCSKQENGDARRTDTKASIVRMRRLSEPKKSTIRQTSSVEQVRRLSEPKMSTIRQISSIEAHGRSGTRIISKAKAADETKIKKISAIVNHDKGMIATLPELKIRTPNASNIVQNRSSSKERTRKLNENTFSMNSAGISLKKNEVQTSPKDGGDDNPIIEKNVVMLECEIPCASDINNHQREEKPGIPKRQFVVDKVIYKNETVSSHVDSQAPISEISEKQSVLQPISTEVKLNGTVKEPSKSSAFSTEAKETYRAPCARVSSLEDRGTRNSECGKAPPTSLETTSVGMETFRARICDSRNSTLEKIPELIEKSPAKESSKGLRKLLKFGRKNNGSVDGSEANDSGQSGFPNEVTLKNLISRDENPSSSSTTPQKSSRTFSLLSPFRSKSSEKKIMMA